MSSRVAWPCPERYSLRPKEIGTIKASPQKIIAQGTDWRFRQELGKESKA